MNAEKIVIVIDKTSLVITKHQQNMLQLAANDVPRKEIAKNVFLSVRTVEAHFSKMAEKFNKKTTAGLIAEALRLKLIE